MNVVRLVRGISFALLLGLVFSIPWENVVTIGSLGTISRVVGMGAAGMWLVSIIFAFWLRQPHPFQIAAFVFVIWNVMGLSWTYSYAATYQRVKTYLQLALLIWMLWDQVTTPNRLRWLLQTFILGEYVAVSNTFSNYFSGQEAYLYSGGRYVATGFDANELGLTIALGIAPAWYLALTARKNLVGRILQVVNFAYLPAAFVTIQFTASRGSLLASIPALIYIFASSGQLHPAWRRGASLLFILALSIIQPYMPASTTERLATVFTSLTSGDMGGRGAIWVSAIPIIIKHPILGVGSGAIGYVSEATTYAHNIYLSILTETGMVGFAIFAVVVAISVYQALRHPQWTRWMWLTTLAVWAVGVMGISWEFRKPNWLLLSLPVLSANLLRAQIPVTQRAISTSVKTIQKKIGILAAGDKA